MLLNLKINKTVSKGKHLFLKNFQAFIQCLQDKLLPPFQKKRHKIVKIIIERFA